MTEPMHENGLQIFEAARKVIPGGVNSATRSLGAPYSFIRGGGPRLVSADNREYIDYHAAFGAILLGHCDPHVDAAVTDAIGTLDLTGYGVMDLEVQFAELVADLIPSVESSLAALSGTEATMQAVRLARAVTGRRYLLKFQGCFHGWHDAVARNVISPAERTHKMDPISAGILPDALDSTLIAEFNDLASVEAIFNKFPDQVAGVILEPIPHNIGSVLPTQEFLTGLRSITEREGALLIFDEVITGFRHALGGYQAVSGVLPDLTTFGKGMANGYPAAGIGGPRRLMDRFSSAGGDVVVAGTFNGHPVSMAAGIATMTYLRDHADDYYPRVERLGDRMRAGLTQIVVDIGIDATVGGFGSVFCLYFCSGPIRGYRDLLANNDQAYSEFHRRMTESGSLMIPLSLKRNHISGAHTEAEIDLTLDHADAVLRSMAKEGYFS